MARRTPGILRGMARLAPAAFAAPYAAVPGAADRN
jgi:hypothetical protein